jgi:3-dehydroquinate dehydratase-2
VTRVLVIHGPNLNLLGTREPHIYGTTTLEEINASLRAQGAIAGAEVDCVQSNLEGEIINHIQRARGQYDAILINPGAYSHTSYAIRDAIDAVAVPAVEVHLTNVHRREEFRHKLVISGACLGVVLGFGPRSYQVALEAMLGHLGHGSHPPVSGKP